MILYAIDNYLAGSDVAAITSSSEDALYQLEYLYDERPSKPFRFTGIGSAGNPEWVCIEFDDPKKITIAALFNHNLIGTSSNDELLLQGCDDGCSACDWDNPDFEIDLSSRMIAEWNDLYQLINQTRAAYRLQIIDGDNADGFIEIGDFFLGEYEQLANARLEPGRAESPKLYRFANITPYGQHWTEALSYSITLELRIASLNDPAQLDAVRSMIMRIHDNNGRFVIIPNHLFPFAYYVHLENDSDFMAQFARGLDCEVSEWSLSLRTLTKGIALL
jgi:hypothetical protein